MDRILSETRDLTDSEQLDRMTLILEMVWYSNLCVTKIVRLP